MFAPLMVVTGVRVWVNPRVLRFAQLRRRWCDWVGVPTIVVITIAIVSVTSTATTATTITAGAASTISRFFLHMFFLTLFILFMDRVVLVHSGRFPILCAGTKFCMYSKEEPLKYLSKLKSNDLMAKNALGVHIKPFIWENKLMAICVGWITFERRCTNTPLGYLFLWQFLPSKITACLCEPKPICILSQLCD